MKNFNYLFSLIFFLIIFNQSEAQSFVDSELFSLFEQNDTLKQNFRKPVQEAKNEIEAILSVSFLAYKTFISSQDKPSCIFTPSCSVYAIEAFHKKGVFMGWLNTFDRLSRCHSFVHHSHYPLDKEKKHFYDPIK